MIYATISMRMYLLYSSFSTHCDIYVLLTHNSTGLFKPIYTIQFNSIIVVVLDYIVELCGKNMSNIEDDNTFPVRSIKHLVFPMNECVAEQKESKNTNHDHNASHQFENHQNTNAIT